jgi:hypothetical protein
MRDIASCYLPSWVVSTVGVAVYRFVTKHGRFPWSLEKKKTRHPSLANRSLERRFTCDGVNGQPGPKFIGSSPPQGNKKNKVTGTLEPWNPTADDQGSGPCRGVTLDATYNADETDKPDTRTATGLRLPALQYGLVPCSRLPLLTGARAIYSTVSTTS